MDLDMSIYNLILENRIRELEIENLKLQAMLVTSSDDKKALEEKIKILEEKEKPKEKK